MSEQLHGYAFFLIEEEDVWLICDAGLLHDLAQIVGLRKLPGPRQVFDLEVADNLVGVVGAAHQVAALEAVRLPYRAVLIEEGPPPSIIFDFMANELRPFRSPFLRIEYEQRAGRADVSFSHQTYQEMEPPPASTVSVHDFPQNGRNCQLTVWHDTGAAAIDLGEGSLWGFWDEENETILVDDGGSRRHQFNTSGEIVAEFGR
jgi:hypothetical protein